MLPPFKRINNESGVVLFIVLMTAIVILIYSLGILTQSMNEINYAQQQIDQIACEQIRKGKMWTWQAKGGGDPTAIFGAPPITEVKNGRTYTITWNWVNGAQQTVTFNCAYNTL